MEHIHNDPLLSFQGFDKFFVIIPVFLQFVHLSTYGALFANRTGTYDRDFFHSHIVMNPEITSEPQIALFDRLPIPLLVVFYRYFIGHDINFITAFFLRGPHFDFFRKVEPVSTFTTAGHFLLLIFRRKPSAL